jgi:hypothetical protein
MCARVVLTIVLSLVLTCSSSAQQSGTKSIPAGATLYIAPMPDGFNDYLRTAIAAKKVPVSVVTEKAGAQFEVTGHSETQKAGAAKKIFMTDWRSNEQASIQVADLASGEVVFAYSVNKKSSAHGKKSTAEACAKHLKEHIEKGGK